MRPGRRFTALEAVAKLQQLLNDSDSSDTDSLVDSCDETSPDEAQSAGDPSDNELSHVLDTFSPFLHSPFPEPSASVVQEQDGSGDNTQTHQTHSVLLSEECGIKIRV